MPAHYNDDALCLQPGLSRDERCGTYRGRAETAMGLALVGYIGTAALGGTSAVLFLASAGKTNNAALRPSFDPRAGRATIDCTIPF